MNEKLLPCPFCGGAAEIEEIGRVMAGRWSAGCTDPICFGYQSMTTYPSECEAVAAWNTRAPLVVEGDADEA